MKGLFEMIIVRSKFTLKGKGYKEGVALRTSTETVDDKLEKLKLSLPFKIKSSNSYSSRKET